METQHLSYLTTEGYIFLILAWGTVASITAYCFYKVLRKNGKSKSL